MQDEATRFERETLLDRKQNHVTGFIQEAQFDVSRFNDERVKFDNTVLEIPETGEVEEEEADDEDSEKNKERDEEAARRRSKHKHRWLGG